MAAGTFQMDNSIERPLRQSSQGPRLQPRQQPQSRQPGGNAFHVVGMQSRHATPMTGIESPQQISYLLTPTLAQDDPIGPHAQCGLDQIDQPHTPCPFDVGFSDSQGNHILMAGDTTKFTHLLHDDQPLLPWAHTQQGS